MLYSALDELLLRLLDREASDLACCASDHNRCSENSTWTVEGNPSNVFNGLLLRLFGRIIS